MFGPKKYSHQSLCGAVFPTTNLRRAEFTDCDLTGASFESKNLRGAEFYDCNLSGACFAGADLTGASFERCKSPDSPVDFTEADFTEATFKECEFGDAILVDARLRKADVRRLRLHSARLTGCSFDGADIDSLDIRNADLHLASFRNARIKNIHFEPFRALDHVRRRAGFLGLHKTQPNSTAAGWRTVFTTGTEMSPFVFFCTREYRLDQIILDLARKPWYIRIPEMALLQFFLLVVGSGFSTLRWFGACTLITVSFALFYLFGTDMPMTENLNSALLLSIQHFLNSSSESTHWVVVMEKILGFCMLGIFVSILTSRFFQRW